MPSLGEKFPTGTIVCTSSVNERMLQDASFRMFVHESLLRHTLGDWGDLDEQDKHANEQALVDGSRLLSAYSVSEQPKVWVITEAMPRASTCVLFPNEY